jgi:biopolymer transport protein ExbB
MNSIIQEMWHTWTTGGPVMVAMAVLSITMFVSALRLLMKLNLRGITRAPDTALRTWVVDPMRAPRRVRELIRYTQDEIHSVRDIEGRFREVEATEVTEMDRGVAFLNVMVISAPLFGLLGTVMGMLLTFKAIGVGGSSTSEVIARGISEALVCTQTGMMVAVPGLVMATMAKRRRHEYVAFLARLEGITLRHFRPEFGGMTRLFTRKEAKLAEARAAAEATAAAKANVPTAQPAIA